MIPRSLWDSQAPEAIRDTLRQAKNRAEEDRQHESQRRRAILEDDWEDILYEALYAEYTSSKVRASLRQLITTEHNVAKRICQELSRVYKWGATRELQTPEQTETFRKLADECHYDELLARANFYTNGLRDVGLAPRVTSRGRMKIDVYLPDATTVAQYPDDPTEAVAQWSDGTLSQTTGYDLIVYSYADPEKWLYWDQHGNVIEERRHQVGRLPVAWVHADERIDTFWSDSSARDMFEGTISVAKDLFRLQRKIHFQSELQPTYQGKAREIARNMTIGAENLWVGPGQWGALNLEGDPGQILAVINARIGWIAAQYGLAAGVYTQNMGASSGFQIRIARQPLEEARAEQIKTWRRVEKELLTLLAHASQDHPFHKLPLDAEFKTLDFHEEPMLEDPATQNRVWTERVGLGITSRARIMREYNPDLTLEQAKAELEAITAENEAWIAMQKRMGAPKDPAAGPGRDPRDTGAEGGRASAAAREQDGDEADE